MRLPIYQIDAFTDSLFGGNPAAVCPLESWLPETIMQAIAAENNLAETAFFVPDGGDYALRWFTPTVEVDLCGHATLAAGYVVFRFLETQREAVRFHTTKAGTLTVRRHGDLLVMNFPARPATPCAAPDGLLAALGGTPREVLRARDHLIVYDSAAEIAALQPDIAALAKVDCWAAIVTAPGEDGVDFASRFFAPAQGVPRIRRPARRIARSRPIGQAASARPNSRRGNSRGGVVRSVAHLRATASASLGTQRFISKAKSRCSDEPRAEECL